jgi:hypothetical protein
VRTLAADILAARGDYRALPELAALSDDKAATYSTPMGERQTVRQLVGQMVGGMI